MTEPSWSFALKFSAIIVVAMVFIVGIQASREKNKGRWPRLSWMENPFGLDRPLSGFDAISYYFLASGVSCAMFEFRSAPRTWAWEFPAVVGVGIWIGVRVCVKLFNSAFR
jgi:hypothetical protein